jgi:hypothetical protein
MDILRVLATRNKAFGEPVVSSIFNYLLDPYEDHGLGSTFLLQYLKTLSEQWSFLDEPMLKRIASCQLSEEPLVRVAAEWHSQDSKQSGRRIDSLIQITFGKRVYLIATELKIFDRSLSDETQLKAYVEMLNEERDRYLVDEQNYDPSDITCALAYLIPGDSKKGLEYARQATELCRDNKILGVLVVPWAHSKEVDTYSGSHTTKSMDEILRTVLEYSYYGEISPADPAAVDIVRCLRNAAKKNFEYRYFFASSRSGQFPDDDTYREALEDNQRILLECFTEAAEKNLPRRPLRANPLHTSIGVPVKVQPKKGENNSLCRILTVESYKTGVPLDRFVLQLSKRYYESNIDIVKKAVSAFPIKAELIDVDPDGKPLYHENGNENEPVYRIHFYPGNEDVTSKKDEIVKGFVALIENLKKAYNA